SACNAGTSCCSLATVICVLELFENILFLHDAYAVETSQSQRVLSFHQELRLDRFSRVGDACRVCAPHNSPYRLWKLNTGLLSHVIISYDVNCRARRDQSNLVNLARFELSVFHFDNILLTV